jgi:hypothetical protein
LENLKGNKQSPTTALEAGDQRLLLSGHWLWGKGKTQGINSRATRRDVPLNPWLSSGGGGKRLSTSKGRLEATCHRRRD